MKPSDDVEKVLKQVLHSTPQQEMEGAGDRVLYRLRSQQAGRIELPEQARALSRPTWEYVAAAGLAAAMVLFAVFTRNSIQSHSVIAEATDSGLDHIASGESLKVGKPLHTDTGASLMLLDGSRVEMRAHSDLLLERADDGVRIRLKDGAIIVNAARQGVGHLYVQTKDVTVSVVGTVFLVGAEKTGSQVAVIEGEVRVEQGANLQKLLPGEKVATAPTLVGPLQDAVSWSRNAESHLALLQQSTLANQRGNRFSVASIRSVGPLPPGPATLGADTESRGFGCHGVDGISRLLFRAGLEIPIPQGRCVGNGVTLMGLISYAYGTPWRFGPDFPAWAQTDIGRCDSKGCFQINAATENPDITTTAQLRAMLQTLLAERFHLQVHRETQNLQTYVFHVAKNGPKLKEYTGELEPPAWVPGVGIRGKSTLDELARFLTDFSVAFVNLGNIDMPFINRTGLSGTYDYTFRLRPAGGGARGGGDPNAGPPSRESRLSQMVDDMSVGFEEDIGLRLDTEKLPIEVIIVDHVEKPTEN
jgi:uncharacterized protein (TIGR03435 family)